MKSLACTAVLRQLQAYHDGELRVADQIAVATHLDGCEGCHDALIELEQIGDVLRAEAPGHTPLPCDEASSFMSSVVNRARVEREVSLLSRLHEMAEDGRFAYSAIGATTATLACLVIMLTMMRFAGRERTDSLAGVINTAKAPAAVAEPIVIRPVAVDARVMMPRALDSFSRSDVDDTVLALSGVVTTEGRVSNVQVNDGFGGIAMAAMDGRDLESLVNAVAKMRFEPVMKEGEPVSVNMVLFVAHTTVRGGAARKPLTAHVRRIGVIHRV
jgi:hypothetical protein